MGDCQSFSNKSKWMEGKSKSLMWLMVWRDIGIGRKVKGLSFAEVCSHGLKYLTLKFA